MVASAYSHVSGSLFRSGKPVRRLSKNTVVRRLDTNRIAVTLHQTDILLFQDKPDLVTVTSGGWRTPTTKNYINRYLPSGYQLYSDRGVWWWGRVTDAGLQNKIAVFTDGDVILRGKLRPVARDAQAAVKAVNVQREAIKKYAVLCAEGVPLPAPGAGDCFYCAMTTKDGASLGDVNKDTDHLSGHMEEGYVVPSLVARALTEAKVGKTLVRVAFGLAWSDENGAYRDLAQDAVRRAVRKFLCRRFGLSG